MVISQAIIIVNLFTLRMTKGQHLFVCVCVWGGGGGRRGGERERESIATCSH